MLRIKAVVLAFVVGLLATLTATGQSNPVQPSHLALEVYFYSGKPPGYVTVAPANSAPGGAWFYRFKRVPGWTAPGGSQPVHAVNVQGILVGDQVRVLVSVFLGLKLDEERNVAAFTIHEGEKIALRELAGFGVEPFELKLVRVASVPSDLPQFLSKVRSIELVTIQSALSTLPAYRLALRNLSTKSVSALVIKVRQGDLVVQTGMPQGKEGRPLVVASGVSELIVPAPTSASATPAGYQPVTSSNQTIEITEAAFADGSSEGEPGPAARYGALVESRKVQLRRVIDLFTLALHDGATDPLSAVERFASKMAVLDPSGAMRSEVMNEIHRFRLSISNLDSKTYRTWLVASKQRYEAWLARL
jgi:hypothetical protein